MPTASIDDISQKELPTPDRQLNSQDTFSFPKPVSPRLSIFVASQYRQSQQTNCDILLLRKGTGFENDFSNYVFSHLVRYYSIYLEQDLFL